MYVRKHVVTCSAGGGRPEQRRSGQPRRRDGQVQVQSRLALLLLHGGAGCWSREELLADRARSVGVAADRVLPQADRQREVAALRLLLVASNSVMTSWPNRLKHKKVRCNS